MNRNGNPRKRTGVLRSPRAQALADGDLVDVTKWARSLGFTLPAACTRGVWRRCCDSPAQAEGARLGCMLDVLAALRHRLRELKLEPNSFDRVRFSARVTVGGERSNLNLVAVIRPGDHTEPTLTVLLRGEG